MEEERRILKSLHNINDLPDHLNVSLTKFSIKSLLTPVAENTFTKTSSGATVTCPYSLNQLQIHQDNQGTVEKAVLYTTCLLHSSQVLLPTQVLTTTHSKDVPKFFPPKAHKLSEKQVNEMRNWRAMHGQSVPQKTV